MREPDLLASNRLPPEFDPDPGSDPRAGASLSPGYADLSNAVGIKDFIGVLRRHWLLIAAVAFACVSVTAYTVYTAPPMYRTAALIRLIDQRRALTGGIEGAALERVAGPQSDPLLSEIQVLKSRAVLGQVVDRLGLRLASAQDGFHVGTLRDVRVDNSVADGDTFRLEFERAGVRLRGADGSARAAYGAPVALGGVAFVVPSRPAGLEGASLAVVSREAVVERLKSDLRVRPRERTDALDLEYVSGDPVLAQRVVNEAAQVFKEANVLAAQQKSKRRRQFVEQQLSRTDAVLANAQRELSNFQSREQVFSSSDKFAAEQKGSLDLEVRREEMEADRRTLESLLTSVQREPGSNTALRALVSSPGLAENPVIAHLYTQLTQYEAAADSLTAGSEGSAQTNPDVQRYRALIASTRTNLVSAARSYLDQLGARVSSLDQLRSRTTARQRGLPEAQAEEARLTQQVVIMSGVAEGLREEYQRAQIAEAVEAGQVEIVDLAALPRTPISTGRGTKLVLSLLLGLILGGGGAMLREHLNTSIKRRDEMESLLQVPSLAVIPRTTVGERDGRGARHSANGNGNGKARPMHESMELVTVAGSRSSAAEAYRTLRTNLIFSQSMGALRTLVVTSAAPGDGKTTTASNLAVAFAQHGLRVALVDCDLRRPRIDSLFGIPKEPGLTQFALRHNTLEQVAYATQVEGLMVVPSGTQPPNPSELLGGPRMRESLAALSEGFDLVVLDTPPLLAAADAAILGSFADGVILVVRAGRTERAAAQQAKRQLTTVGAKLLGAVLNDPDAKMARYGGYGEYGYYGYYGSDEPKKKKV